MYKNTHQEVSPEKARIPITLPNDKEALAVSTDKRSDIDIHGPLFDLPFDSKNNLPKLQKIICEMEPI